MLERDFYRNVLHAEEICLRFLLQEKIDLHCFVLQEVYFDLERIWKSKRACKAHVTQTPPLSVSEVNSCSFVDVSGIF